MKLRYLLLFTTAIGACGSLLLGADMYRRIQDAEALITLNSLPLRQDSVLVFGMSHTIGLISLAFLFLGSFLLLIMALRDPAFVAALANQKIAVKPTSLEISPVITSIPIAEAAAQVPDVPLPADSFVPATSELQPETREVQDFPAATPLAVEPARPQAILAFEVPVPLTPVSPIPASAAPATPESSEPQPSPPVELSQHSPQPEPQIPHPHTPAPPKNVI